MTLRDPQELFKLTDRRLPLQLIAQLAAINIKTSEGGFDSSLWGSRGLVPTAKPLPDMFLKSFCYLRTTFIADFSYKYLDCILVNNNQWDGYWTLN